MTHSISFPYIAPAIESETMFATAKRILAGVECAAHFAKVCTDEHRHGRAIDAGRAAAIFSRAAATTGVHV